MRLIDVDALIERMQKRFEELRRKYGDYDQFNMGYSDGIDAVENAPVLDVATVMVDKKITREQELSLKGKEFKEYIKKQMAVELAYYLLENEYIKFAEDRDKDVITIIGLLNVVKETSENAT